MLIIELSCTKVCVIRWRRLGEWRCRSTHSLSRY
jgi:hypothetical protein